VAPAEEEPMRRLALASVIVLFAAVPSTAAAYLLSDELLAFIATVPPTNSFAVGEGKLPKGKPLEQFSFAAHGSALDASGHARFRSDALQGEARGHVDCLVVSGNHAAISGTLDEPFDEAAPYFVIVVEDNGEPSGGTSPDEAFFGHSDVLPSLGNCGAGEDIGDVPLGKIAQGNIVVEDRNVAITP
jgi:hypothetical protein